MGAAGSLLGGESLKKTKGLDVKEQGGCSEKSSGLEGMSASLGVPQGPHMAVLYSVSQSMVNYQVPLVMDVVGGG